jgi:hypothetical protein
MSDDPDRSLIPEKIKGKGHAYGSSAKHRVRLNRQMVAFT